MLVNSRMMLSVICFEKVTKFEKKFVIYLKLLSKVKKKAEIFKCLFWNSRTLSIFHKTEHIFCKVGH